MHIARFRLLLEVINRTGLRDLDRLGALPMHLRAMDSLIPWEGARGQQELLPGPAAARLERYGTAGERERNKAFLGRDFHVVVGNPPYVTPKDPQKRDDYRVFWPESARGAYGLMAPFADRFFRLGCDGAFTGQITSNAFAKRSFGIGLITQVLPRFDLTDIIDTSGAYIPGHGTPTVILLGRHRPPVGPVVRCVFGKQGEPAQPDVPSEGVVWQAIVAAGRKPEDENPFVSVSHVSRATLSLHPWNMSGGGAPALQARIEKKRTTRLGALVDVIGRTVHTGLDPVFVGAAAWLRRLHAPALQLVLGQDVRDFIIEPNERILFPYNEDGTKPILDADGSRVYLWSLRTPLKQRRDFGQLIEERGLKWFEWSMFFQPRFAARYGIGFAFVSTHNHFVLNEGGRVFKQTAPVIKLPADATRDDHLDLLGLLNSSTLGFWMKQVFFDKGFTGGGAFRGDDWEVFYEFDATKLKQAPITTTDRPARVDLARALHDTAQTRAATLPTALLAAPGWTAADLPARLTTGRADYAALTHRMVALQEELDWLTYRSYGLLTGHTIRTPDAIEPIAPGHRPFEIALARHNQTCAPEERSSWFTRHGHAETPDIPSHYTPATRAPHRAPRPHRSQR
ncbi:MAG: BREX-2 system adenine-specific DNA-methyltransferase PglX [bacterium]